jgi:transposase
MNTNQSDQPSDREPLQGVLFEVPAGDVTPTSKEQPGGTPRLKRADRRQIVCLPHALDDLLPEDHEARIIWAYVEGLDLTSLHDSILAVEGHAGRTAADRQIFMALWLYATLKGVGSARQLAELCERHVAYRWICGGVTVNHHTLSDFRTAHGGFLDRLLTQGVAGLMHEGLVEMERVAQDGMRVRASAGAASFRRRETLEKCLAEAKEQVQRLRAELESDPAAANQRQKAARQRAARERLEGVQKALDHLPELEARRKPKEREKTRVSTTDAEATVMKMGDGGYRPAYNVQLATDTATQIITGVDVVTTGGDQGQLAPMVEQHAERYQQTPEAMLVDGGFVKKEAIEQVSPPEGGTLVYAPVMESKDPQRDRHTPCDDDSPAVAEWRVRMGTPEAKEIYKERAATAECVNAIARNRNLQQFRVRGRTKVRTIVLWYVLVHNLMRVLTLRAEAAKAVE